ncbi:MAG TPA: serine hydrolase domain-containing protein [Candidatus Polarisedimenticolia bacterium]|jgi:CubicO group peptidase (beta-lactamase class C family)|nr:serine hydrolase domain-containing protein [Candidatus Polarisedimenticolia bacterium]
MKHGGVERFLREKIEGGIFPGARYLIARGETLLQEGWLGHSVVTPEERPVGPDTIYDLASLTKPLVTGTLAALMSSRGALDLEEPVEGLLPELAGRWIGRATLLDLLAHRSGLPAWQPLYLRASDREGYLSQIGALPPDYRPRTRVVYSCLGYILLALGLERRAGASLAALAAREVFGPLGLQDTGYRPAPRLRPRVAATEEGNARERELIGESSGDFRGWNRGLIWGECHDLNAWTLGGVSGNAGLFSSAGDLHRLSSEFLGRGTGLFNAACHELFRRDLTPGLNENRSVGWQLAATPGASAGPFLSSGALGHTGFTGTSLWIDPAGERIFILLTNRVHPKYRPDDMNAVRREFHRLALQEP